LRREIAELRPRHCEEQSDEATQTFFVASGLLRFARNDDEVAVLKPVTDGAAADALIFACSFHIVTLEICGNSFPAGPAVQSKLLP
jgi:hypothetical protein